MNQGLYRLAFSAAKDLINVVNELASNSGKRSRGDASLPVSVAKKNADKCAQLDARFEPKSKLQQFTLRWRIE
jgi:hypothetical protein